MFQLKNSAGQRLGLIVAFHRHYYQRSLFNSNIDYYHFLDSVFTDLQTRKAESLIIDLRQNNGGDEQLFQEELSYLLDKPWEPYRSAHVKTTDFSFPDHTDDWVNSTADRIKIEFQKIAKVLTPAKATGQTSEL